MGESGAPVAERERHAPQPLGADDGLYGIYYVLNQIREEQAGLAASLLAHEAEVNLVLRGDKGNGDKGLSWRMRDVEREILAIKVQADRIEAAINARGIETERGRWSLAEKLIIGFLSGLFLLAATALGAWLKGGTRP